MKQKTPTENEGYFERALISLKRIYSKDETVLYLTRKLSESQVELGKALSYIDELEQEKHEKSLKNGGQVWFDKYNKLKKRYDDLKKMSESDQLYSEKCKEVKKLYSKIRNLEKL